MLCISYYNMNNEVMSAIKRQVPFLIGGTITGIIMSYFLGFVVTIIVNSIMWYLISLVVYKRVWKKNGLTDQMVILKYALTKIKRRKYGKNLEIPHGTLKYKLITRIGFDGLGYTKFTFLILIW